MKEHAGTWTRFTNRLNVAVWALPLPRRARALLSRHVYRNPPMPAERVVAILDTLEAAGVEAMLMGGWGIDALVGHQRRVHRDLDLIVAYRHFDAALATLRASGFEEWFRETDPAPFARHRMWDDIVVMRDAAMRVVELHPIRLIGGAGPERGPGSIGGRPVTCVSAETQVTAHRDTYARSRRERKRLQGNLETAGRMLGSDD